MDDAAIKQIETSIQLGSPLGNDNWVTKIAGELGLESTLRPRGRPREI